MLHYADGAMAGTHAQQSLAEEDHEDGGVTFLEGQQPQQQQQGLVPPPIPDRRSPPATNRYSYRQAIYNRSVMNGGGNDASNVG